MQQLSISLESRGFGSNGIKTSYRQVKGRPSDWVVGIVGVVAIATLSTISIMKGTWSLATQVDFSPIFVLVVFLISATLFAGIVLAAIIFSFKK